MANGGAAPLPRAGCAWWFTDTSPYHVTGLPDPVTVGTCRSDDLPETQVWTLGFACDGFGRHVDAVLPPGTLERGPELVEVLLAGARFGGAQDGASGR